MTATVGSGFTSAFDKTPQGSTSFDYAFAQHLSLASYPAVGDYSAFSGTKQTTYPINLLDTQTNPWATYDASVKAPDASPSQDVVSPDQLRAKLDHASQLSFTSPEDNRKSGQEPDYILGTDGKLRATNREPNKDGSVNIEIQAKNKADIDAKKYADKLQKAAVKDLIGYFSQSHPGAKVPQEWLDQLQKEPDLPPAPSPISSPRSSAEEGPPQDAPRSPRGSVDDRPASANNPGNSRGDAGNEGFRGAPSGDAREPGQGYRSARGNPGGDDSVGPPTRVPDLPDLGTDNPGALAGNRLLTQGQQAFAEEFAKKTGMDVNVVGSWLLSEESGGAARGRERSGDMNWLNIGKTDSGYHGTGNDFWHSGPVAAADASAAWMKGELSVPGFGHAARGITHILDSAHKSPGEQVYAIQSSPWASGHYPGMAGLYRQVVANNREPHPTTELASAKRAPAAPNS